MRYVSSRKISFLLIYCMKFPLTKLSFFDIFCISWSEGHERRAATTTIIKNVSVP